MRTSEQNEILGTFLSLLEGPTGDGGAKRGRGEKVSWKIDPGHKDAGARHLRAWLEGEPVDPDSGCHPLTHLAWRALAIAWQEMNDLGLLPNEPPSPDDDKADEFGYVPGPDFIVLG